MIKGQKLPGKIVDRLTGKVFRQDEIGMSEGQVYLLPGQVLKIQEDHQEARSEYEIMRWLEGRLPVPQVIAHVCEDGKSYLLMTRLGGKMACDEYYMARPGLLTQMLAAGLKRLWQFDVSECPCRWGVNRMLAAAKFSVEHDMVDMEDAEPETFGEGGFCSPKDLYGWLEDHKPEEEPVLSHGDFCLPNLIFQGERLSGYVDLGRMGIADKWRDIALCYRSLLHNYNGKFGGKQYEGYDPEMLFEQLGIAPDWDKIKYYILMDELF